MAWARLALVVAALAVWQWAPEIPGITKWAPIFDPFFISSPERIAAKFWALATEHVRERPRRGEPEAREEAAAHAHDEAKDRRPQRRPELDEEVSRPAAIRAWC
jgi:hypothetical protein